jgi:hypothetical protein
MSLKNTNLYVQAAPLPATFKGTPQEFFVEIIRRMKILSPNGTNFIFIGDIEPTSNVGPWLRGGTKWYVWSDDTKRYGPLDISDSETQWFHLGTTTPTSTPPFVWLRTTKDATDVDPTVGSAIGWYVFDGSNWVPFNGVVSSGPTASRPVSPVDFQQFYDADIGVLIWWERGAWRTVSGVPGDVKFVAYEVLTDATRFNPGWEVLGNENQAFRGRLIVQAAKDSGSTPETTLTVGTNLTARAAFETFGEEHGVKIDDASTARYPGQIALWCLVKT